MQQANDLLTHRGPDDSGFYLGNGVGLGARRLSIIDLAGGHQPLSNEDGTIWITYNGEVYNAPELRQQLQAAGHHFRTTSDTEAIVHAYEAWGEECLPRLRGMFAFGLWDGRRQRLLLARDRFGIKPLYYAQLGSCLAFASEIRPLLAALPQLPRQANLEALRRLFTLGFIPTPLTALAGVWKLPAAHYLVVEKGQATVRPYWQLRFPPAGQHQAISLEEATEQFKGHLKEAVDAWRLSDVPVGSLLSGGIDSSALAALLTELSDGPIHTFHIAFQAASHDESAAARQTAQALGSRHHELTFTPADFDALPTVVRHLEEPQCSATSVPIYLLYRACHEAGFKVIMTGEGADELLGGYHWFEGDRRARSFLPWPRPLRTLLARTPLPASAAARRVLAQGTADPWQRFTLWHQVATPQQLSTLFSQERNGSDHSPLPLSASPLLPLSLLHPLDQFLFLESQTRMVDFINFEVDRMSMASSVEARPPFLDHVLWEFCARLPPGCKLTPQGNKWLLRQGLPESLPAAVRRRPKKGLATPHAAWWRAKRLPAWAEEGLHPAALAETAIFTLAEVARLRHLHRSGQADASRLLMGVLTTQLWHQEMAVSR